MSDPELDRILAEKSRRLRSEAARQEEHGRIIQLTNKDFDTTIASERPTFVDFWAEWCGPCRAMEPVIDRLASRFSGRVTFGKLNVDEQPEIATRYDVSSIPTFMIFRRSQPVDAVIGAVPGATLGKWLERALAR